LKDTLPKIDGKKIRPATSPKCIFSHDDLLTHGLLIAIK